MFGKWCSWCWLTSPVVCGNLKWIMHGRHKGIHKTVQTVKPLQLWSPLSWQRLKSLPHPKDIALVAFKRKIEIFHTCNIPSQTCRSFSSGALSLPPQVFGLHALPTQWSSAANHRRKICILYNIHWKTEGSSHHGQWIADQACSYYRIKESHGRRHSLATTALKYC